NNPIDIEVKIRYNSPEVKAKLIPFTDHKFKVLFEEKQRAVTPGQSAVFYKGDLVIGGGIIKNSF
ncbi:MAG: tRNA 2-thiouridine(34) synthase MnmA, partial [Halanaerobiales bacterium]|nr:tRNA 2-thiouridine(34) synthase MnmA [Halanaerobiales bacterium]